MALKREPLIWIIVIAVFLIAPSVFFIEKPEHLAPGAIFAIAEATVTILGVLYVLFVLAAWHWRVFYKWFVMVPDLRGTWRGSITPLDASGSSGISIPATLIVKQTLFAISCTLYTANMQSRSFSGSAFRDEASDEERLIYSYSTDPILSQRELNPRADGTAIFSLQREKQKALIGRYFTDRLTRGTMRMLYHSKKADAAVLS
jgi:hypothetical protein